MQLARRWFPRRGFAGGRRNSKAGLLAVNFSFVLHEASHSDPVRAAVRTASSFKPSTHNAQNTIVDGDTDVLVNAYLVPSIGDLSVLSRSLQSEATLIRVDRGDPPQREVTFFRAPARLTLPSDEIERVGVAALVTRPGRRSSQLIVRGPFNWRDERQEALRTLEALIQAHVDQWLPWAQLWEGPAEELLPDEVH